MVWRGLPRYLIPFATHAFVHQCHILLVIFAIGILCSIYAFHHYTTYSNYFIVTQDNQYRGNSTVGTGYSDLIIHLDPLNPMIPDNAWILRITAAVGGVSRSAFLVPSGLYARAVSSCVKQFTTHRAVILRGMAGSGSRPLSIFLTAPP